MTAQRTSFWPSLKDTPPNVTRRLASSSLGADFSSTWLLAATQLHSLVPEWAQRMVFHPLVVRLILPGHLRVPAEVPWVPHSQAIIREIVRNPSQVPCCTTSFRKLHTHLSLKKTLLFPFASCVAEELSQQLSKAMPKYFFW